MFGREWKNATATVIVSEQYVAAGNSAAGMPSHTRMVVEVHPPDGAAFRAKVTLSHLGVNLTQRRMNPPQVGETLQVRYNPKNHDVKVLLVIHPESRNPESRLYLTPPH